MTIRQIDKDAMEKLLENMEENNNSNLSFAKGAHSLWFRFKNYEKNAPYVILTEDSEIAAVCMITKLQREPYANLYEIFSVIPGYASELYWGIMKIMKERGVERLKMSCTPSSIGWHMKNGIVGWGTDPSGSIRVDIPMMSDQQSQLDLRVSALSDISLVIPPEKQGLKLLSEENNFGPRKLPIVEHTIETVGEFYFRKHLMEKYENI